MVEFLTKLFDSKDSSIELHNILGCLGVLVFFGLSIYETVWKSTPFSPSDYGTGLGLVLGGTGLLALGQGGQRKLEE